MKTYKVPLRGLLVAGVVSALTLSTGIGGANATPPGPPVTAELPPQEAALEQTTPAPFEAPLEDYATACADPLKSGLNGTVDWCVTADMTLHYGAGQLNSPANTWLGYWNDERHTIQRVEFHGTPDNPTRAGDSIQSFFANMSSLREVVNAAAFDTSQAKDMWFLFTGDPLLESVDVSQWDTSNAELMGNMFDGDRSLETLDVSRWKTGNVTAMSYMFSGASSLKSLDVSEWDTSKVGQMGSMFAGARSLESLDVSAWNTQNLTVAESAFDGAESLSQIDVSRWDTSKLTTATQMFRGAKALDAIDLSGWDTRKLVNTLGMFDNATGLTSLDLSGWDTSSFISTEAFLPPSLTRLVLGPASAFQNNSLRRDPAGSEAPTWTQIRDNGLPVRDSDHAIVFTGNDLGLMQRSRDSAVSAGTYVTKLADLGELVFQAGEGSGPDFARVTPLADTLTLPTAAEITAEGWTHPGYVFKGWQLTGAGPIVSEYTFPAGTPAGDLVTLTAVWEVDPAASGTLTFAAGAGTGASFSWTKPLVGAISLPTAAEVSAEGWDYPGYSFAGWRVGGSGNTVTTYSFAPGSAPGATESFTAVWTKDPVPPAPTGTLSFTAGNGTGTAFTWTKELAGQVTLPTGSEVTTAGWSYPGHTFAGWKLNNTGSTLTTYTFPAGSPDGSTAAFTAVWTKDPVPPAPTGTLSFTAGSGTGTAFTWTKELAGQVTLPTAKDVAAKGWKNTGHSFTGWKLDGKGETLKKYTFPSTAKNGAKASFTAVWTKDPVIPQPPVEKKPCTTRNTSPVFLDTPLNHKFYKEIDWMYCMKYTTGIKSPAGLTYEPKSSLTREAMAAFIYRLQAPKNYTAPTVSPFADVNPGDKFYTEITWMHQAGLSTGTRQATGKPLFAPKDGLSREAMAAFIYRLEAPKKYQAPAVSKLADMKKGDKFYTEVSWMYDVKLSTGNKVGAVKEYWPKATLSREAMAAFIYRLVETYRPNK